MKGFSITFHLGGLLGCFNVWSFLSNKGTSDLPPEETQNLEKLIVRPHIWKAHQVNNDFPVSHTPTSAYQMPP